MSEGDSSSVMDDHDGDTYSDEEQADWFDRVTRGTDYTEEFVLTEGTVGDDEDGDAEVYEETVQITPLDHEDLSDLLNAMPGPLMSSMFNDDEAEAQAAMAKAERGVLPDREAFGMIKAAIPEHLEHPNYTQGEIERMVDDFAYMVILQIGFRMIAQSMRSGAVTGFRKK